MLFFNMDSDGYYNNSSEMPEVPDVAILYCGELPHHKMGIRLNTYKNFDEGSTVGRIMGYNDLSDRKSNNDLDFSEFMTKEERKASEVRERERKKMEEARKEEQERLQEEADMEKLKLLREEVSREEQETGGLKNAKDIFNKVNNLTVVKMEKRRKSIHQPKDNRVLYSGKPGAEGGPVSVGGERIDIDTACELKEICWGGSSYIPKPNWIKSSISFHEPENLNAFGIRTDKGATKEFQIVLQAYILKQLMFEGKTTKKNTRRSAMDFDGGGPNRTRKQRGKTVTLIQLLRPSDVTQREILIGAIAEILWKVGGQTRAVLAIPDTELSFEITPRITADKITEKLRIFKANKEEEAKNIVKKHISYFMQHEGGGLILLLYSIVLSRGIDELRKDLQSHSNDALITPDDNILLGLSNLMLTGVGTPYLHNGIMTADTDDATNIEEKNGETGETEYGDGKVGISGRNDIGFLLWGNDEEHTMKYNLGSRLKTPVLPIWVTFCSGQWGVLFNPNRDLMKSYQAENRFQLYYYSDTPTKEKKETVLTIDTRSTKIKQKMIIDSGVEDFDEVEDDPLEKAIETKWEGATVDWGGIAPYV
ncbi:inactive ubiquitin carboxyl-terminal hydrolase MINDY-4B isoform X2 [Eurytemora carolleeae]|uniref:inactive ubiquitin carboxyl-terminal hydrolase MINDY-4B isoform X2 n=1 Tax=Eurytemora carolleeae TaxID=1294199 RepID=UPI000C7694F7|nr:inactive ubiquitin carboxyl-terminal hydrolase MINDY-4B isoform X2 [Eurytemora carolleeae]|eukprot:XP_023337706.1 inactive ubiquitin carboxyl-terminal hydrolase MINDY-4B-like isoform X2 [Eurytemora affinis]